jgi:hypothetical protein
MADRSLAKVSRAVAGRCAALACAAVAIAPLSAVAADPCSDVSGVTCDSAPSLTRDLLQGRIDRTLASDPAQDRITNRLNGTAPKPGDVPTPFMLAPDGNTVNFTTSLTQWGSAFSAADRRALDQAKSKFGDDLTLPKPAPSARPDFDLWAQSRHEPWAQSGTTEGDALTTYIGADYRLHADLLFGAMVQMDDAKQSLIATRDSVGGEAFMAGPYLAYQLAPNLTLGGRAAWGEAYDSASFGADTSSFATNRMLTEAELTGNWAWGGWQLKQTGAVTYVDETASATLPGAAGTSIAVTRVSAGPEVKRHIDAGFGNSLEPFAFFKTSIDLDSFGVSPGVARNTVGGGVTLSKQNDYKISATADYSESTGEVPDKAVAGKVSVSVPLTVIAP